MQKYYTKIQQVIRRKKLFGVDHAPIGGEIEQIDRQKQSADYGKIKNNTYYWKYEGHAEAEFQQKNILRKLSINLKSGGNLFTSYQRNNKQQDNGAYGC